MKELRSAARGLAAATRGEFHPSPDELLAYQAGDLDPLAAERVLRHLTACPECAQTVLDIEFFPEVKPVDPEHEVSTAEVADGWSRFAAKLDEETEPAPATSGLFDRLMAWLRVAWESPSFVRTVAAALLVVTVGLSWTVLSQQGPTASDGPKINLTLAELAPLSVSGQRGDDAMIQLPASAEGVVLTLALIDQRTFPTYALSVIDETTGALVWESLRLERSPEGVFVVQIDRDFLAPKTYRLDLRGLDGDRVAEDLASYRLELVFE